jgi:hypothetical protein
VEYLYREGFEYLQLGYASAIGVTLFVAIFAYPSCRCASWARSAKTDGLMGCLSIAQQQVVDHDGLAGGDGPVRRHADKQR